MNIFRYQLSFCLCLLLNFGICTPTICSQYSQPESGPKLSKFRTALNLLSAQAKNGLNGIFHAKNSIKLRATSFFSGFPHTKALIKHYIFPFVGVIGVIALADYTRKRLKPVYHPTNHQLVHHTIIHNYQPPIQIEPVVETFLTPPTINLRDGICVFCSNKINENGITLAPCNHNNFCDPCSHKNFIIRNRALCPICNQNIDCLIPTRLLSSTPNSQPNLNQTSSDEELTCKICYEPFQSNRVKLEPCGHNLFCEKCITANQQRGRTTCPYCNQEIKKITNC